MHLTTNKLISILVQTIVVDGNALPEIGEIGKIGRIGKTPQKIAKIADNSSRLIIIPEKMMYLFYCKELDKL